MANTRPPLSSFLKGSQSPIKPPLDTFVKPTAPAGQATVSTPFPISQEYGQSSQYEPQSGGINYGRDYETPPGTPVTLPDGTWRVVNATSGAGEGNLNDWTNQGYGNSVLVKNEDTGEYLRASHLSDVQVAPDQVFTGGVIGMTGASGHVTGPHLDLEYYTPEGKLANVADTPYKDVVMDTKPVDVASSLETSQQPQSAQIQTPATTQSIPAPTPQEITPSVAANAGKYAIPPDVLQSSNQEQSASLLPAIKQASPQAQPVALPAIKSTDYHQIVNEVATKYGLDPALMEAQIIQESGGDPTADSGFAKGISQFTPETGRAYGLRIDDRTDDRLDPTKAIDAQGRYMRDLLKQHGTPERALSAYNSGQPDAYLDPSFAQGQTYNYVRNITSKLKR